MRQLIAVPPPQEEDGIDRAGNKAVARQRKDDVAQWEVDGAAVESVQPCVVQRADRSVGSRSVRISRREIIDLVAVVDAHHFSRNFDVFQRYLLINRRFCQ